MLPEVLKITPKECGADMLLKAIYSTNQVAMPFCKELVACMKIMYCERSKANRCIYFKWAATGLILWLSWMDDNTIWVDKYQGKEEKAKFMKSLDCEHIGPLTEYVW